MVEGCIVLLLKGLTIEDSQGLTEEESVGQAVEYQMMEVLEEPYGTGRLVDFQTIEVLGENVVRTYTLLEPVCIRFKVERLEDDIVGSIVAALLQDIAVLQYQVSLQIRMGCHYGLDGLQQIFRSYCGKLDDLWDVVLQSFWVLLAVDIDTTLIFRQRIELLFLVYCQRCYLCRLLSLQSCHLTDGRLRQNLVRRDVELHFLTETCRESHGRQRSKTNRDKVSGNAKLLNSEQLADHVPYLLFRIIGRSHHLGSLDFRYGQYATVNLSVGRQRHCFKWYIGVRHHVLGQ